MEQGAEKKRFDTKINTGGLLNNLIHICTCLLSAPSGGQGAGPIPCSIEGCHADHVGGVACQIFKLHPELWQEQSSQALRLVLELKLPEVDLRTESSHGFLAGLKTNTGGIIESARNLDTL